MKLIDESVLETAIRIMGMPRVKSVCDDIEHTKHILHQFETQVTGRVVNTYVDRSRARDVAQIRCSSGLLSEFDCGWSCCSHSISKPMITYYDSHVYERLQSMLDSWDGYQLRRLFACALRRYLRQESLL